MTARESPILFSAQMVRAILAGRKTQTRRVLKPQPPADCGPLVIDWGCPTLIDKRGEEYPGEERLQVWSTCGEWGAKLPWHVGDRLWVREAWRALQKDDCLAPRQLADDVRLITYEADPERRNPLLAFGRVRPSIHMPRWASRITLEVTGVRVERVQAISEADATAEGALKLKASGRYVTDRGDQYADLAHGTARAWFCALWQSIHGPGAWEANPWIIAIHFKRVTAPAMEPAP